MEALTVGEAAAQTGWSARMLRYLETTGLVVPKRAASGYRIYGLRELNQLRSLRDLAARQHSVRGLGGLGAAQARAASRRLRIYLHCSADLTKGIDGHNQAI